MKPIYIAGVIALFLLWQRGAQARQAELTVKEGCPKSGDFTTDLWRVLNGGPSA